MRICVIGAAFSMMFSTATTALAQVAGALDVGSGAGQFGSGAWQRESRVAPAFRLTHSAGFLHMDAAAAERVGKLSLRSSSLEAAINSPAFGVLRGSVSGRYVYDASQSGARATTAVAAGALSAKLGANGVWIGTSRALDTPAQLNLGVWRVLGSAIVSLTSQTQSMRVATGARTWTVWDTVFTDTGWVPRPRVFGDSSRSHLQRWSDVEARVDWSLGRLVLTAAMTGRRSQDSVRASTWGRVNAAVQLNSRVSIVAGAGTLPAASGSGVSTSRFATFGLKLAPAALLRSPLPAAVRPAASAFAVQRVSGDTYKLTLRVPNARTVEFSGDFNQWQPIALRETAPNIWEATLALTPGTHRVNVRVDGDAWAAPPGLPAIDDDFNGRVGILVVR